MNKTKIEWCKNKDGTQGYTWNPYYGCLHNCDFCYAKDMVNRFGETWSKLEMEYRQKQGMSVPIDIFKRIKNFEPTFIKKNFDSDFPQKPSFIFVNSMSDIAFWDIKHLLAVINKIKHFKEHRFIFLTKQTNLYNKLYEKHQIIFPDNCWLGFTPMTAEKFKKFNFFIGKLKDELTVVNSFVSIEPLIRKFEDIDYIKKNSIDWVTIGAMSGGLKSKYPTRKEWVIDIKDYCIKHNIPLFLKNSLINMFEQVKREMPVWK